MKKIFISFVICLLLVGQIFAKGKKQEDKYVNYFDSNYLGYEFLVQNPLFFEDMYFTDLNELKNKYFLKTFEAYYLDDDGTKTYSDGDTWDIYYEYYKFDNFGRIEMLYEITIASFGYVIEKKITSYTYKKNKYIVKYKDFLNKIETIDEYSITEEDGKLIIQKKEDYYPEIRLIFEKGNITKLELRKGKMNQKKIITYSDDIMIKNNYFVNKDGVEEETYKYTIKNGVIQKRESSLPDGNHIKLYEVDKNGKGKYESKETRGRKVIIISDYLERRFNKAGFLEYEIQRPFKDGEPGDYTIKTAKILNEPDELLMKYFPEQIKGR